MAMVCPITNINRGFPLHVVLDDRTITTGVILCEKVKALDISARNASFTVKMDRFIKFNKYEKAGVKEYWIVEPEAKLVSVFVLQENRRYGRPDIYTDEGKIKVSVFFDLVVDLKPVFEGINPLIPSDPHPHPHPQ